MGESGWELLAVKPHIDTAEVHNNHEDRSGRGINLIEINGYMNYTGGDVNHGRLGDSIFLGILAFAHPELNFPSQIWFGGFLEVVGGALLALGLFTRPVAFLLSGEMAVAYFQFHAPGGFWPVLNGGVSAALYCFVWLYFSAAGAGPWSLDARRGR